MPAWNVPAVVARYMTFNPTAGSGAILIKNWSVREKISTAYAKANIEHDFGDISLRGNVGVQVQHTKQSSDSKYFNGALAGDQQVQPIHDGKSYNDWLPSMNLNFGLPNDQTVRVAYEATPSKRVFPQKTPIVVLAAPVIKETAETLSLSARGWKPQRWQGPACRSTRLMC